MAVGASNRLRYIHLARWQSLLGFILQRIEAWKGDFLLLERQDLPRNLVKGVEARARRAEDKQPDNPRGMEAR